MSRELGRNDRRKAVVAGTETRPRMAPETPDRNWKGTLPVDVDHDTIESLSLDGTSRFIIIVSDPGSEAPHVLLKGGWDSLADAQEAANEHWIEVLGGGGLGESGSLSFLIEEGRVIGCDYRFFLNADVVPGLVTYAIVPLLTPRRRDARP